MQKLLATSAHRVFMTDDPACPPSPPVSYSPLQHSHSHGALNQLPSSPPSNASPQLPTTPMSMLGNLRGVVSVLDGILYFRASSSYNIERCSIVLSVFARLLGVEDVDPARAARHRRASSTSVRSGESRSISRHSAHSSRSSLSLSLSNSAPTSVSDVAVAGSPLLGRAESLRKKRVRLSLGSFVDPTTTAGVQMSTSVAGTGATARLPSLVPLSLEYAVAQDGTE